MSTTENNEELETQQETVEEILQTADEDTVELEASETTTPAPTLTKEEELAIKNGWKPKDQYAGDSSEWKTAKQFNDHARMVSRIMTQERDLENLKKYMNLSQKQMQQSALETARKELELAKEAGDFTAYEEARNKQVLAEQGLQEIQKISNEDIERIFLDRNKDWLDPTNSAQIQETYQVALEARQDYPNDDYLKIMEVVERRIFDRHPEYRRQNTNIDKPIINNTASAVNRGVVTSQQKSKSFNALAVEYQREYESMRRTMEKQGISYTKEEYVQGLKDFGEI